jgi:hypothetical protein
MRAACRKYPKRQLAKSQSRERGEKKLILDEKVNIPISSYFSC